MLRRDGYLHPALLQVLGAILLVAFAVIWEQTGKESSLLVGAALILIGVGSASGAIITVRQEIRQGEEGKEESPKDEGPKSPYDGTQP